MPLRGRKPFQRLKPPKDLRPNEELFYCKITHEVFREYEQFFDRVILCNSLVWTCSLTGRPGLTFQEAIESEKNARLTLKRFPEPLKRPILFLATLTQRGRLNDMCDDVYAFIRDRYFVREVVEVTLNGIKKTCEVTKVISPEKESKTPTKQAQNKRVKNISPDKVKYEIKEKEHGKTATVKSQCISRPKGGFTKANNKLFLRHHTSSEDGVWTVKDSAVAKYSLANFNFKDVSCGPLPKYTASPTKKRTLAAAAATVPAVPDKRRKRVSNGAVESTVVEKKSVQGKLNFKKDAEERTKALEREQLEFEKQRLVLEEERAKRREEVKKRLEEDRERQRAIKMKEREQKKEEKRKLAEYMNSWKKPRDDLECDDLKDLPKPCPVDCNIPQHCFGDAIMVLQFLGTFAHLTKLKDSFPHGFTFEHLEKSLMETDIQGYFNDLIQMLLTSIFQYSDFEDRKLDEKMETKALKIKILGLKSGMAVEEVQDIANAAAALPQINHGTVLQSMPLDSFSITEILRLHILSSGSENNLTYSLGPNGVSEDPGLHFMLEEPQLLEKLATTSIYQLNCEERLKILTLLIQQLAGCDEFRNYIEENFEKTRHLYNELKQLRWTYARQQKDTLSNGSKKRGDKDGKNSEGQPADMEVEKNEQLTLEQQRALGEKQVKDKARRKSEFLRKEREIKAKIQQLQSAYQTFPIGRDRAYRRYWSFSFLPGVFIEDDDKHVGPCLLKETPQVPSNTAVNRSEGPGSIKKYLQHLGDSKNGSSDKENDILQDLAIIQSDFSIPLKGRKLSDLNTRVDTKKSVLDSNPHESVGCLQCKEKRAEFEGGMPWYCPHLKTSSIFGLCTASIDTCPVHNLNAPRTTWSFYYKHEDMEALLSSLNSRGFREGALKDALVDDKDAFMESMSKCQYNLLNKTIPPAAVPEVRKSQRYQSTRKSEFAEMKPEVALEVTLRDVILELECRIFAGGLGSLKVDSREKWREAVEGSVCTEVGDSDSEMKPKEEEERTRRVVKDLALALLKVSDGIETKFLEPPLALNNNVKNSMKRLERWQKSLLECTSLSQLFVYLGTLERSVAWSRSILNAHCRICRRRGDAENMLLCDQCNRGHHLYCLKPPLETIPEGDWFCLSCKPPEKVMTPKKKRVNYNEMSEDEEEVDDDGEEEEDEEESGDEEEEESDAEQDESEQEEEVAEEEEDDDGSDSGDVEVCETCGGTGTVICCDKCPKVYHPECIGLRRIPRGEWLCPSCTKKMEVVKKTQRHSPTGSYSTRAQALLEKEKAPAKSTTLRTRIQIKASKRKRSNSSDSECNTPKRPRQEKKGTEKENPFKKVYKDSALNMSRRRSKSSGATDMLDYKTCLDLLVELMHHPSGWPFLVPVSKKDAPDYHLIIKRPMDFGTIRSNLNNMAYKNTDGFVRDLFLVLQNCELFNPGWSAEYEAARDLHKVVLKLLDEYQITHSVSTNLQRN